MPDSLLAYAEIRAPGDLIKQWRESTLRKSIEGHPLYVAARENNKDIRKLYEGLDAFEKAAGIGAVEAFDGLAGRGIALGFRPLPDKKPGEVVVFLFGRSGDAIRKSAESILKLNPTIAPFIPVPKADDTEIHSVGEAHYCLLGDVLMIANSKPLLEEVRKLGKEGKSLATSAAFTQAAATRSGDAQLWAYADTGRLAKALGKDRLLPDRYDNILGPILVGGVAEAAARAPHLTLEAAFTASGLRIAAASPTAPSQFPTTHAGMIAPESGRSGPVFPVGNTLLNFNFHRDLAAIWSNREHTLKNDQLAGLAQLDNLLTSSFGGKDFGQEILPWLHPDMQLFAVRQTFEPGTAPQIRLPAFAWAFHVHEPRQAEAFQRSFKRFVGLMSYILGEQAKGDVDIDRETYRGAQVWFLSFEESDTNKPLPIRANFSPAMAVLGDRFALCSTRALARELIDLHKDGKLTSAPVAAGSDLLSLDVAEVRKLLEENRENLILQTMASKGHDRAKAAAEIGALFDVVDLFRSARVGVDSGKKGVKFEIEIKLK